MKRYLLTFGVIAASILALSSCNREEDFTKEPEKNKVIFTFTAEKAGEETKTAVEEGASKASYIWTTEDQAHLHLYLIGQDGEGHETKTEISHDNITFNFSSDHKTLTLTAAVEEADSYTFRAVLAGAFSGSHNPQIKAVQAPATDNFDPSADLLVSDDLTTSSPADLSLTFNRKAVINKMTLKNITPGEKVKSVVITSTQNLTGTFSSGEFTSGDKTIRLNYSQPTVASDGIFPVYFAAIPKTGHTLTVTLTTDQHKYTKTFGGDNGIAFNQGAFTRFGVTMPAGTAIDNIEGQYYIAAMPGAWMLMDYGCTSQSVGWYAGVSSGATTTAADVSGADFLGVTDFEKYFWNIEAVSDGYTIQNDYTDLYLSCASDDNYASYRDDVDETAIFDISMEGNVATILSKIYTENSRQLRYNSSGASNRFAFYKGTQNVVYLIPTYDDGLTGVALSFPQEIVNKTTSDYSGFTGLTLSADPNISSILNAVTYGMEGDAIGTVNASTGVVSLNGTVGTATVTAVFPGDATYRQASASYMIVVSSASGPQYLLVSTVAGVTEGDYIITWDNSYYLPSGATSGTNPAVGTGITVANEKITNVVTSDMVWTFTGNNTDGFTISDGTNILHSTNAAQGISITTNSTRKWTVSVDGTYGMLLRGDDGGTRNLAVYSSSTWRYYATGSNYTGKLRLYKLEDNRLDPGMSWSASTASASITDDGIVFNNPPTLTQGNASGITYNSTDEDVATISDAGVVTIVGAGVTEIQAIFAGNSSYHASTVSYTLTVTDERTPSGNYDFETVAELNALVTTTSSTYSGYLTNAVVSFVPATNTAIIKDATGSVMYYKSGHGLLQGQTYTGEIEVTAIKYNGLYSEITVLDASFTGSQAAVAPESLALSSLIGHYDEYQNAYVQVAGLTVVSISGKNINVTDGTNNYVVYDNPGTATCGAGDVITVKGTITKYQTTEELKVWAAADITITSSAPKAITFSQPSEAGCSFTVNVAGVGNISSGATVASGKTVTLTATAGSGYNFSEWVVSGATVANATASTTTFTMGTSAVSISASFLSTGGGTVKRYVKVTTGTIGGEYLIVRESSKYIYDGSLSSPDNANNYKTASDLSSLDYDDWKNYAVTIESYSTGYSIKTAAGYYIGRNANSNGIDFATTLGANYVNTISFASNGTATILGKGGRKFNFNSSSGKFRYFASSNTTEVYLYQLKEVNN